MKLNADGGIDVYVAAEQPEGVPAENWLPINRQDENLDIILRIYVPDVKKLKSIRKGDAVYITGSSLAHVWMEDILSLLREKKVPAVDMFAVNWRVSPEEMFWR